jgi:hypothetical protein
MLSAASITESNIAENEYKGIDLLSFKVLAHRLGLLYNGINTDAFANSDTRVVLRNRLASGRVHSSYA